MAEPAQLSLLQRVKRMIFTPPILHYLRHMRFCSYYSIRQGVFYKILFLYHYWRYKSLGLKLGFSIGYDVFGYGLHIPHYGTIVVNGDCKIGNYCVLHTCTCIGGTGKVIGDGLYVGTGAKIMGKINLGDNVSIASQSLVNKSFGENDILLAGMPAIVKKKRPAWYAAEGGSYQRKVEKIERLKIKYGIK